MTMLEDDIREVLDRQAQAMQVPQPHRDRTPTLILVTAQPRPRRGWMLATAAVLIGVAVAAVVLIERPSDKPAVNTDKPAVITITTPDTTTPEEPADTSTPTSVTPSPPTTTVAVETDLAPSDLAPNLAGVLAAPSPDEAAQASDDNLYNYLTGDSEVTAQGRFVALRKCAHENTILAPCAGTEGWKYLTGSADSPEVHLGLLDTPSQLVVSPIDDRLFVASGPAGSARDPHADPSVWLIDSITGRRGALTWHDEPTTFDSPEQELLLYPASDHAYPGPDLEPARGFLPRVLDRRDWSIRPLSVPSDASAALSVHQSGSGWIWVATAPDGGEARLSYTDDGGESWTRVELPPVLRPTSAELTNHPDHDPLLTVAASGDHVAVSKWWGGFGRPTEELFVSTSAGANWRAAPLDPTDEENAMEVFALADGRLVVAMGSDAYTTRLFVSSSAADWLRLDESLYEHTVMEPNVPYENPDLSHFDVSQRGVAGKYYGGTDHFVTTFSIDLNTWWAIPNSTWLFR